MGMGAGWDLGLRWLASGARTQRPFLSCLPSSTASSCLTPVSASPHQSIPDPSLKPRRSSSPCTAAKPRVRTGHGDEVGAVCGADALVGDDGVLRVDRRVHHRRRGAVHTRESAVSFSTTQSERNKATIHILSQTSFGSVTLHFPAWCSTCEEICTSGPLPWCLQLAPLSAAGLPGQLSRKC